MKKILLGLVVIGLMTSCKEFDEGTQHNGVQYNFDVVKLDGCEYYVGYRKMAHKGNCTNIIHEHIKY